MPVGINCILCFICYSQAVTDPIPTTGLVSVIIGIPGSPYNVVSNDIIIRPHRRINTLSNGIHDFVILDCVVIAIVIKPYTLPKGFVDIITLDCSV